MGHSVARSNHIFRIEGKCDDLLALRLIETHCVPILTYGIEVIFVSDTDIWRQLRVAYNLVFRRIFHYRPWQSVCELQSLLSRPNWEELLDMRTYSFTQRVRNDRLLRRLFFDDWHHFAFLHLCFFPLFVLCHLSLKRYMYFHVNKLIISYVRACEKAG